MSVSFGTSGLRGLTSALTQEVVASYTTAFVHACPVGPSLYVGRDLRASSPSIAQMVVSAARAQGVNVTDCGAVSTPALALAAMQVGAAAVMVTGSHIPADRNGLKFYLPSGEISKADETAITAAVPHAALSLRVAPLGALHHAPKVMQNYIARYSRAFGPDALRGLRLGVYQHSSVARDALVQLVQALGGHAVALGRADTFIPVDTESVDTATRAQLADWAQSLTLDAVVSTDGDADRPLLADATGQMIAGDVLGVLTARLLRAAHVCTPVSSNSMIEAMGDFAQVSRCKIGSPYVIAQMNAAQSGQLGAKVVGFEANGGFLLGFDAQGPCGPLPALMTRDAFLPLIAPLALARAKGQTLHDLLQQLPARVTAADRITPIAPQAAQIFLAKLTQDKASRAAIAAAMGLSAPVNIDTTDGLRMTFDAGRIVHLRPSGNAPEFRVYVEADSHDGAQTLLKGAVQAVRAAFSSLGGQAV